MDAGYFRNDGDAPKASTPIIKVNITEAGVPDEKLLVMHVRNDGLDAPGRVNIAGNSFVGTGRAFLEFYPKYYHTFWHWISIEKFIATHFFQGASETGLRCPMLWLERKILVKYPRSICFSIKLRPMFLRFLMVRWFHTVTVK